MKTIAKPTAAERRRMYIASFEKSVAEAVAEECQVVTEEGFDGEDDFQVVEDTSFDLEVDGDAAMGFLVGYSVSGYLEYCAWSASFKVKSFYRNGKHMKITLRVEVNGS